MAKTMAEEQNSKTDAPYLSEEVLDLLDIVSQLRGAGIGMLQDAWTVGATLLLVKQIKFLREDLREDKS